MRWRSKQATRAVKGLLLAAALSSLNIIYTSLRVPSATRDDTLILPVPGSDRLRSGADSKRRRKRKRPKSRRYQKETSLGDQGSTLAQSPNRARTHVIYLPAEKTSSKPKNASNRSTSPTFLFGIPSYENGLDKRQAIRDTYLSCYKETFTPNRICSLRNFSVGCQVAYAFFVGGNPNGPTELLEPNTSFPLSLPSTGESESDVILLNIRENQMEGKMPTWFKYAASFQQFDYIAKVDDDTLVLVPNFLHFVQKHLPDTPHRVYGGLTMDADSCDPDAKDGHDHPCPLPLVGDVYMSGELNFMSRDLALDFTNTKVLPPKSRAAVTVIQHEDVSMSNYVFSVAGEQIQILSVPYHNVLLKDRLTAGNVLTRRPYSTPLWGHSVPSRGGYFKDLKNFRGFWLLYFASWRSEFRKEAPTDLYQLFNPPEWDGSQGLVHAEDFIYSKRPLEEDASPVVVHRYKLVFFIVPGAADESWKDLLLRMQLDSNEAIDGRLRRLSDFSPSQANRIMTSYSRAMMVRDPRDRLAVLFRRFYPAHKQWLRRLCGMSSRYFADFLNLIRHCSHVAWRPQAQRMEPKYNLTNVLQFGTKEQDSEALLRQIGAWNQYGTHPLFPTETSLSKRRVLKDMELPIMHDVLEEIYHWDYANSYFNFSMLVAHRNESRETKDLLHVQTGKHPMY